MRRIRPILAVVLAAALALGAEGRARVRVRDGDTGHWLAGVQVKSGELVLTTDRDGEVIVPAVAGRRLILAASTEGFFPAIDTVAVFAPTVVGEKVIVKVTLPAGAIGDPG